MFYNYDVYFILEVVLRLIIAGVLGGIIGYERETENKPAGFRTYMLVCIGSALVMVTSEYMFTKYSGLTNMDPARLGAQVISGIGFLGAGTIIRDGVNVRGLTTAAGLWVVACVGIAVGTGFYVGAIISTVFIYLTLITLKKFQESFKSKGQFKFIYVQTIDVPGQIGAIGTIFGKYDISIKNIEFIKPDGKEISVQIKIYAHIPSSVSFFEFMKELHDIKGIEKVSEG